MFHQDKYLNRLIGTSSYYMINNYLIILHYKFYNRYDIIDKRCFHLNIFHFSIYNTQKLRFSLLDMLYTNRHLVQNMNNKSYDKHLHKCYHKILRFLQFNNFRQDIPSNIDRCSNICFRHILDNLKMLDHYIDSKKRDMLYICSYIEHYWNP